MIEYYTIPDFFTVIYISRLESNLNLLHLSRALTHHSTGVYNNSPSNIETHYCYLNPTSNNYET